MYTDLAASATVVVTLCPLLTTVLQLVVHTVVITALVLMFHVLLQLAVSTHQHVLSLQMTLVLQWVAIMKVTAHLVQQPTVLL